MTTLLQSYLAYQRDIGCDEIVLPEPWIETKAAQLKGENPKPMVVGQNATAAQPEKKQSLDRSEEWTGQEDPTDYLRQISARLTSTTSETVDSKDAVDSVSPGKSRPKTEKEGKPLAELEFGSLEAWKENFTAAAPSLHPTSAGHKVSSWVLGKGVTLPLLAVIGMQPSAGATTDSGPFFGPEGELLEKMLRAIKLEPGEMYYTSLMKASHPGRGWARRDSVKSVPWLAAEMRLVKPQFILAMGEDVAQILTRLGQTYPSLRQKGFEFAGCEMAMTWDPGKLIKEEALKKEAWQDLKWLVQRLKEKGAIA